MLIQQQVLWLLWGIRLGVSFIAQAFVQIHFRQLPSILQDKRFRLEFLVYYNTGGRLVNYTQLIFVARASDLDSRREDALRRFTERFFVPIGNVGNQSATVIKGLKTCQTNSVHSVKPKPAQEPCFTVCRLRGFFEQIIASYNTHVTLRLRPRIRFLLVKFTSDVGEAARGWI